MAQRFYLDTDNSSHWYIIPMARRKDWERFLELPEDDEASWTVPTYAREVGGSPTLVTFEAPKVGS